MESQDLSGYTFESKWTPLDSSLTAKNPEYQIITIETLFDSFFAVKIDLIRLKFDAKDFGLYSCLTPSESMSNPL